MARDRKRPAARGAAPGRRAAMADSATQDDQCHPRKIFVGGLAHRTSTAQLREHFAAYGDVVDAVVLRWPDSRSRGFGYVAFAEVDSVLAVLRERHVVDGRDVDVKRAVPGTNKLFVGGLPQAATAADLRDHFEAYGAVSDAVVMMDPATARSRGFGFVCFLPGQEGAAAVATALEQYDRHRVRGKWVEVKSAAPTHKLAGKEAQGAETPASSERSSADATPPVATPPRRLAASAAAPAPWGRPAAAPLEAFGCAASAPMAWPAPGAVPGYWAEAPPAQGVDFVAARGELQRSLELLLRLQLQAPQAAPAAMQAAAVAGLAPPGLGLESGAVSQTKVER